MFAVINITTDKRKGFFAGLVQFFSPCVIKSLTGDIPVYDVKVPMYSRGGVNRCRRKLVTELHGDGTDRFLCSGGWKDILIEEGFQYVNYHEYFLENLLPAVLSLCEKAGEDAEKFNIVLHSPGNEKYAKKMFSELSEIFRNVTLITKDTDAFDEIQNEIAKSSGAATIVTDSFSSVSDAQIIISLSETDKLFNKGKVKSCTVIFTADIEYRPTGYIGASLINAFCPKLSPEQLHLCESGIAPWELAAALDFDNGVGSRNISEFYSFGRTVSVPALVQDLLRKIKLEKEKQEEFVIDETTEK